MKLKTLYTVIIVVIICFLTGAGVFAQNNVQKAYDLLNEGKFDQAEELFIKDTESPDSFRAHLGLAFLYDIESKYDKEWEQYSAVIKQSDKPEFYLLPEIDGLAFNKSITNENSGILELLNKEAANKEDGFISAVANENLGQYYELHNQLDKAKDYYKQMGSVNDWSVIGPFENVSSSGYYEAYPPEKGFNPNTVYTGKTISRFIGLI